MRNLASQPTAEWISRQITQAFPWNHAPQYLIRDGDTSYGPVFMQRLCAMGIRDRLIAFRSRLEPLLIQAQEEATAQTTDVEETISNMTLCAGGMRSSFDLAISRLKAKGTDATSLGLAIGFEFGPMNVTRLGMKGELIRCSVSRGVIAAEKDRAGRACRRGAVADAPG